MYPQNYVMPNSNRVMYRNVGNGRSYAAYSTDGDRFFLAPFLVGGLAGTALGYGIANNNNNQNGQPCCYPMYPVPYYAPYPAMSGSPAMVGNPGMPGNSSSNISSYSSNSNYFY